MAIWLKFKGYIIVLMGALSAIFGIYMYGRRTGSQDTQIEHERANIKKSREIEDAADRVRRADGDNATPIERLRRYKRIRDVSDGL
jgi:hypothetical protein